MNAHAATLCDDICPSIMYTLYPAGFTYPLVYVSSSRVVSARGLNLGASDSYVVRHISTSIRHRRSAGVVRVGSAKGVIAPRRDDDVFSKILGFRDRKIYCTLTVTSGMDSLTVSSLTHSASDMARQFLQYTTLRTTVMKTPRRSGRDRGADDQPRPSWKMKRTVNQPEAFRRQGLRIPGDSVGIAKGTTRAQK